MKNWQEDLLDIFSDAQASMHAVNKTAAVVRAAMLGYLF